MAHAGPVSTRDLPRDLTTFVGRRRELGEVREAMSSTPLLTLIGPAGVGKTRLALRAAADVRRAFPDGVYVVELAELRDPALLAETVASAIGVQDASSRWLVSTLVEFIGSKRILIVLDNCEHLADASAILADSLLRACPGLRLLGTSREPLGIDGETVLQLAPLPLPGDDRGASPDGILHSDAVRLFVDRARAALPSFEVTDANAEEVVALCRRLDGLPLALELAAGRLRAFSVGQVLEQLAQPFEVLAGGKRTASVRHQSLRAAIEWSFGLLSEPEQVAWRRLSVFAGSFDLEAAEAVGAGDAMAFRAGEPTATATASNLVAALVDKSILRREPQPGRPRFRMLETIRDFGRERLREAGEEPVILARHDGWYARLADQVFEGSWGPPQLDWWDRAHLDLPNVRDVLARTLEHEDRREHGLQLVANLCYYWLTKGSLREGRRWIDALLAASPAPTRARSMALTVAGWLAQLQGDLVRGLELFVEAHQSAGKAGDPTAESMANVGLGGARTFEGQLDVAEDLLHRCLEVQAVLPDRRWEVNANAALAAVAAARGDHLAAQSRFHAAAELCRAGGDRFFLSRLLPGAAHEAAELGDWAAARELWSEGLRLNRIIDDRAGMALAIEFLAWAGAPRGRAAWSARLYGGVETLWASIPARLYPTLVRHHEAGLAAAKAALGDRAFDKVFHEGTLLTLDRLVALALEEPAADAAVPRTTSRAAGGLTARESEIAALVAEGLSNRDIADRLVISQRTAETHVEHILSKLGFTSRAQVAAWVVQQDAPEARPAPAR